MGVNDCITCHSDNTVPTGYGGQLICRDCGQIFNVHIDIVKAVLGIIEHAQGVLVWNF